MNDRPLLIDERDGPCEFCAAWSTLNLQATHHCADCGQPIGIYQNMGGNGFQSPCPHHFHIEPVAGVMGRRAVYQELCLACYNSQWRRVYPDLPLPAPPMELESPKLPKEITAEVTGELLMAGCESS